MCHGCHNPTGVAAGSGFVLEGYEFPDYLEANYEMFADLALIEHDGAPIVLQKPTEDGVSHGGGRVIDADGAAFDALSEMIDRMAAPHHCPPGDDPGAFFDGLVLADEATTLRKATLLLASRLPTADETEAVDAMGIDALDPILEAMMEEDAFYERIKSFYNEQLQTDFYLQDGTALAVLDPTRYPGAAAFGPNEEESIAWANEAVAREPLNIVENVLRKRAPFTEILTGDYTMVNPYSAMAYGLDVDGLGFADPLDPTEFVEHSFSDIPQPIPGHGDQPSPRARQVPVPVLRSRRCSEACIEAHPVHRGPGHQPHALRSQVHGLPRRHRPRGRRVPELHVRGLVSPHRVGNLVQRHASPRMG
jgi:hypothetical protein